MGSDLRMPAAFKALQRSRPPEAEEHAGNGTAHSPKESGSSSSPSDSPGDASAGLDDDFDFDDYDGRSQQQQQPQQPQQGSSGSTPTPREDHSPRGILSREASSTTRTTVSHQDSTGAKKWEAADDARLKFAASSPFLASGGSEAVNHSLLAFSSTASFSTGVDMYGFKKPVNDNGESDFNAWAARYTEYMKHREEKWTGLLKAHGLNPESQGGVPVRFPPESQRLRRYVRKGIPPKWRGNAWFWFARGHEKLSAHPGLYKKYVDETEGIRNSDTEHIERDLHRTFPDNIYFRNDPITNTESMHLKALRRVLTAFSVYQPKIGYCQSLNFIAGNLLLFMEEERAFWMLVIITQNYLTGLHEVNLEQVNISQGILMISVRDRLPKIWNALNFEPSFEDNFISNLPPISLCTAPWFMSLMVNVLPTETMLRVWDCFFLEGPKTLYRISLAIFKLVEPQMSRATDELEVFQIIQSAPRSFHDPEVLMKACFKRANGFGHISNEDIALLRAFVQNRRKQALQGIEQRLSDRHAYAKLHRGRRVRAKLSLYR